MKHIQKYKEFSIDERLTFDQKMWLNVPRLLISLVGKYLFGIYPHLNFKWNEIKSTTTDRHYTTIIASAGGNVPIKMDNELIKINKGELPDNKMKVGMFLRDWNLYLAKDYKSKGGDNSFKRSVVYITKDEISKGDMYTGERLTDSDIYPHENFEFKITKRGTKYPTNLKDPEKFPIIIMIAKFSNVNKIKEMESYVDDICLEIEDDFPVDVDPDFSIHGDHLGISIKVQEGRKLIFSDDLNSRLEDVSERIKDYLKMEKYKLDYKISYMVKGQENFYYYGDKGRFKEIIKAADEYDRNYDKEALWISRYKCLDVYRLSGISRSDIFKLYPEDMRTLLSDIDKCYNSLVGYDLGPGNYPTENKKIREIELSKISIIFNKVD